MLIGKIARIVQTQKRRKRMDDFLFLVFIILFWYYGHQIKKVLYALRLEVMKK